MTASPTERRLINLAIYSMLLVSSEDAVHAKLAPLYAQMVPLARKLAQAKQAAQEGQKATCQAGSRAKAHREATV